MAVSVCIGAGELVDRLNIYRLKFEACPDAAIGRKKRLQKIVVNLAETKKQLEIPIELEVQLQSVNSEIWRLRNNINSPKREFEEFAVDILDKLVTLSRKRIDLKRKIDKSCFGESDEFTIFQSI